MGYHVLAWFLAGAPCGIIPIGAECLKRRGSSRYVSDNSSDGNCSRYIGSFLAAYTIGTPGAGPDTIGVAFLSKPQGEGLSVI